MQQANFQGWQQYLAKLCGEHYLVLHGRLVDSSLPVVRSNVRRAWFRMNDFRELLASEQTAIHYPAVVHEDYSFFIKDNSGTGDDVRNGITSTLLFIDKPTNSDSGSGNVDAIEEAQQRSWDVMQDFIARMWSDYLQGQMCGPILFSLNNVRCTPIGTEFQEVTGWRCALYFETKNNISDNVDGKWINEPLPDYSFSDFGTDHFS